MSMLLQGHASAMHTSIDLDDDDIARLLAIDVSDTPVSAPVVSPEALLLTRQLAAQHLELLAQAAADAVEGRRVRREARVGKALSQTRRLATEMQDDLLVSHIDKLAQLFERATHSDALDHAVVARRLRDTVLALGALAGGAAEAQLRAVCLRRRGMHPLATRLRGLKGIGDRRLAKLWDAGLLSTDSLVGADPTDLVTAAGIDRPLAQRVIRMASAHLQERARGAAELLEQAASEAVDIALGGSLEVGSRDALLDAAHHTRRELDRMTPPPIPVPSSPSRSTGRPIAWLGSGGEADLLKAVQRGPGGIERVVALKRVTSAHAADPARRARLAAEGRLLARINHPNVLTLLDVMYVGDEPQLVLELLVGTDMFVLLEACSKARRRMPPALAVTLGVRVARALAAIHAVQVNGRPLAHGDVAHHNVMLTHDGRVKVLDFGVAAYQELDERVPAVRGHAGSLAPETLASGIISPAGDQFSLAVLIWEAMTLRRLFTGENTAATLANLRELDVRQRFMRYAFVPEGLQAVLARALERNPADRFADAAAFGQALETWLVDYGLALADEGLAAFVRELVPTPIEVAIDVAGERFDRARSPNLNVT